MPLKKSEITFRSMKNVFSESQDIPRNNPHQNSQADKSQEVKKDRVKASNVSTKNILRENSKIEMNEPANVPHLAYDLSSGKVFDETSSAWYNLSPVKK